MCKVFDINQEFVRMLGVFQEPVTEIESLLELKYSFLNVSVADFFIERSEKVDNGK